jgi:uncharacterized short protein YbdD (DUF466 family)
MKDNVILVVTSLLSLLLLTLHITDDIVRGISKAEPSNTALVVLVVFLYGTLALAERRSGYAIKLLVGLFAAAMPVIHMRGAHYGEIAKSAGGFFFVWTLWAPGWGRRPHLDPLRARSMEPATRSLEVIDAVPNPHCRFKLFTSERLTTPSPVLEFIFGGLIAEVTGCICRFAVGGSKV